MPIATPEVYRFHINISPGFYFQAKGIGVNT